MTKDVKHALGVLALAGVFGLVWLAMRGNEADADTAGMAGLAGLGLGLVALFLLAQALMSSDD